MNRNVKTTGLVLLFLVMTSFLVNPSQPLPVIQLTPLNAQPINMRQPQDSVVLVVNEFNQEELIQLLKDLNVKYPHIVLAQSILETGHYNSKVFKENHNLFGMKEARVRIHTAKGTKNGHAYYNDWKESVYDYAFYQSTYYSDVKSEKQYYRKLDRSYAEAKNYVSTLKEIVERENLTEKFLEKET